MSTINQFLIGDTKKWVIAIGIVIFGVTLGLWFAYEEHQASISTEEEPQTATAWGLMESDSFKALISLIVVPIFILLFERRFKIFENYQANIREKISQRIKENRENRLKTIDSSLCAWNKLYSLTTEIAYFDISKNPSSAPPAARILELIQKVQVYTNETEDLVNEWTYRFQNLTIEEMTVLVRFINILFGPASTVAHYIRNEIDAAKPNATEIRRMQSALLVIQNAVKSMYHHPLLAVLKDSTELLTVVEDNIPEHDIVLSNKKLPDIIASLPDEVKKRVDELQKMITGNLQLLSAHEQNMFRLLSRNMLVLPIADDTEKGVKEYREAYTQAMKIIMEKGLTKEFGNGEEYRKLKSTYMDLHLDLRFRTFEYSMSKQGIIDFADWCNVNATLWSAEEEAERKKREEAERKNGS